MIDEKMVQLLLQVEKSITVLSGYVRGVLMKEATEPVILVNEKEVIENEKRYITVSTDTNNKEKSVISVSFDFTRKELKKMKENFVKHYTQNGLVLNVRAKGNVYEIRYRRDGLNLSASAKVLEEAKTKMKALLITAYAVAENEKPRAEAQKTAIEYITWYIDEVKRPNHNERYIAYLKGYVKNHLRPAFGNRFLSDIPFSDLQRLMSDLTRAGKNRTAKGIRTLLKEVYRSAIYDGLVKMNHADRLAPIIYQEEHGEALTLEMEKEAIQAILRSDSAHKNDFLILLFLGLRPCELRTLKYDGDFAEVVCAKKRTGLVITRRIPLSPMFRRYVDLSASIRYVETRQLEKSLAVIFGNKISLYDFRHTFITRAQECGVPENVVQAWVGHSQKTLTGKTYTHFSDKYMIEQSKKIEY